MQWDLWKWTYCIDYLTENLTFCFTSICSATAHWTDKPTGNITFCYNALNWAKTAHCRDKLSGNVIFGYNTSVGQRQPSWVETETNRKCYFIFYIFYNTFSCAKTALWRDKLTGNVTFLYIFYIFIILWVGQRELIVETN